VESDIGRIMLRGYIGDNGEKKLRGINLRGHGVDNGEKMSAGILRGY
jgi:hypothetical protein